MVSLTRFFGRTASEGAAFALGSAVGPALSPAVRQLLNETWSRYESMPLSASDAALAAALDVAAGLDKQQDASYRGVNAERFQALVDIARSYPPLDLTLQLLHRDLVTEDEAVTLIKRLGYTETNAKRLVALREVLLSPADLAMMRQQGFIERPRQIAESAKSGVDAERADLLFEISGLPPGVETALEMLRRSIITESEFAQIVREGHTKTKYTDELLELRHPVLSATQAATLRLKGYITPETSYELGALTGYTPLQMDRLWLSMGRPMAPVQAFTAWARGVDGPDGSPFDFNQFEQLVKESDVKTKYTRTLWGIRHAYPSLFQLRRAVQDGGISRQRALTILHYERYEDADALALVNSWTAGTATGAKGLTAAELTAEYEGHYLTQGEYVGELQSLGYSLEQANEKARVVDAKRVKRARDSVVSRIRSEYVRHRISRDVATAALVTEAIPAEASTLLMTEWDHERELTADAMTAAQIKKAYKATIFDRATALARIERLGYDADDAGIYLDES
jgi:hypothetical protein